MRSKVIYIKTLELKKLTIAELETVISYCRERKGIDVKYDRLKSEAEVVLHNKIEEFIEIKP